MAGKTNLKSFAVISGFLLAAVFISYGSYPVMATTYYVNPGESIQAAIDSASYGETVQVAAGTYVENITLKNGVKVLGAGPLSTTIDGAFSGSVVTSTGCDPNTILEGFTIANGTGTNVGSGDNGGGMWNSLSNPTITNCTFSANVTEENGGGMWNSLSNPTLTNCTFTGNSADHGGGMYNLENSSPTLTNCTFSDNSATYSGGMHNCIYCWPTLTSCTFTGNSAAYSAAGMYNADYSSPTLTNCTFSGNSADWSAGGMFNSGNSSPTLTNCTFTANLAQYNGGGMVNMNNSSPTLTNCTFTANSAQDDGGGMVNYSNSSPTLANCTFSGNSAGYFAYGGGMCNSDSNPTITNCIMWADTAYYGSDEIYNDSSTPSISYSDIEGCGGSGAGWDASLGTDGGGNIDADPLFVSASDLHLQDGSPCIDAGINSSVPVGVTADIDGELRIIDGDGDILAIVDMGSDEYLPVQPQVWVDDDYTPGGGNDGHSWGIDAFSVIQTGIGAAGYGSTVYVAAGTYVENITLKNGVKLLGAGPLSTTIDGDASGSVVTSTGCDPNTILTGFTITNGYAIDYGGGMYNEVSSPTVTNCTFSKNAADFGGGMYNTDNSSPAVTNCTFTGNSADYGAGMFDYNNSSPMLTNCTFSGNSAVDSGGGMFNHQSSPAITNCVLWDNTAADGNEITLASSSTIDVNYCDIKGGQSDIRNDGTGTVNWGSGNITDDPLFVDADGPDNIFGTEDDNLRLSNRSPCIDAGNNTAVPAGLTTDLDGKARFVNDPETTDTGSGIPPIVDMGAYEFHPQVLYVDANASPAGNGSSWETAFKHLQDAFEAAVNIDMIWVAQGVYYPDANSSNPDGIGDRSATFALINGVSIYGGFPSGGGDWEQRDPNAYETILSGDINTPGDANDNSYHVVTGSSTEPNAILDGLTITAGNANASSPVNNYGGGMYNYRGSPTVTGCTFSGNSASRGGGMCNYSGSSPALTNCTFRDNVGGRGGGMYNVSSSSPTITNCTFGKNRSGEGGGMFNLGGTPAVTNCTFSGNTAGAKGGAMFNYSSTRPTITNCTFSGNTGGVNGSGGLYNLTSAPCLANCILWGNRDSGGYDESGQIMNSSSTTTINYSCVQGWTGSLGGTGNIGNDPLFYDADGPDNIVGTADDNLRLWVGSPCIDTGDNNSVPADTTDLDGDGNTVEPIPFDLDGHPRIIDGDCNDTEVVDMGAYEFNYAYMGDFDYECDVDFEDFDIIGSAWMSEARDENWDRHCDISVPPDEYIDWRDVKILCDNWLAHLGP